MSVIEFRSRALKDADAATTAAANAALDHRKWQCGKCEATVFHLWCDGVIACAECGSETLGLLTHGVTP